MLAASAHVLPYDSELITRAQSRAYLGLRIVLRQSPSCINMERINIERRIMRNHNSILHSDSQNTPQSRLQITVQSFRRPRALEIAFEILACSNSHFQMGHLHLASLLSSQSVSRGHQVFNLKRYGDQFASRTREGRTYLATVALLGYQIFEGVAAVNGRSLKRSCPF
jgi:hypothetical protein